MDAEEYPDDVRRILNDYVDPESITEVETRQDLEDADFGNPGEVADALLTRDDVEIDRDTAHQDGVTTREEVESEVSAADEVGVDERQDAVTDAVAREVGAPTEQELRDAQFDAVKDQVTPEDTTSPVAVARDRDGDAVAVIASGSERGAEQVADDLGTDVYSDVNEYTENMSVEPAPDGRRGLLRDRDGNAVGEVEL